MSEEFVTPKQVAEATVTALTLTPETSVICLEYVWIYGVETVF
jgi:hypothetical protein